MPIIYAVIGQSGANRVIEILHCVAGDTPLPLIAVIKKIVISIDIRKPGRKTQICDNQYLISYLVENGFLFLASTQGAADSDVVQISSFIENIRATWQQHQLSKDTASAFQDIDWNRLLNTKMAEWSAHENQKNEHIRRLQEDMVDVRKVMLNNVENLIQRNDAIQSTIDKTELLNTDSEVAVARSKVLTKQLWYNNLKMWFWLGLCCCGFCCFIIFLIIFLQLLGNLGNNNNSNNSGGGFL